MYTFNTNLLYNVNEPMRAHTPEWFDSERYYNCENFYSMLKPGFKKKSHRFGRK